MTRTSRARTARINLRVTPEERDRVVKAASFERRDLADFVRLALEQRCMDREAEVARGEGAT